MKRTIFLLFLLISGFQILSAQDRFSILVGGIAGVQKFESSDFRDIYGNSKFSYGGIFGVGNGETYIGATYRVVRVADGSTKLNAIPFDASWKEQLIVAGFHYYPPRAAFHFEAGYAWVIADESLTPPAGSLLPPQEHTYKDHGLNFVGGLSLGHDLRVNLDVGYLLLFKNGSVSPNGSLPNLGGFYYGATLCFLM